MPAVPLAVELLYEAAPDLDADRIAARIQTALPKTVAIAKKPGVMLAHEDFPQEFEEGTKAILTLIVPPDPGKDGENEFDLSQSWAFHGGHEAVGQAASTLLVAEMVGVGAPPDQRVTAFRATLQALVEETGPRAIWSPAAQELVDPARFDRHPLNGLVNVRLFRVEDGDADEMLMDTLGLHTLGLADFQMHFRGLDESVVGKLLADLANHALTNEFENGDTVGDERWRVQFEQALAGPDRTVLDVNPGPPYAAGER